MTTAYDKYKEYQEEVTPQEYEADEKEYLAKIKKLREVCGDASSDDFPNNLMLNAPLLGLALLKDPEITNLEYRFYWLMCPSKTGTDLHEYRIVEIPYVAKTRGDANGSN